MLFLNVRTLKNCYLDHDDRLFPVVKNIYSTEIIFLKSSCQLFPCAKYTFLYYQMLVYFSTNKQKDGVLEIAVNIEMRLDTVVLINSVPT